MGRVKEFGMKISYAIGRNGKIDEDVEKLFEPVALALKDNPDADPHEVTLQEARKLGIEVDERTSGEKMGDALGDAIEDAKEKYAKDKASEFYIKWMWAINRVFDGRDRERERFVEDLIKLAKGTFSH